MQRRYAGHSPDTFSVQRFFPGWKIHPAVFDSFDNPALVDKSGPLYMLELGSSKTVSNSTITIALPVTEKSARTLELTIVDLLEYQSTIQEVVVVCPELLLSTARSSIRHIIASYGQTLSTQLTLLPCPQATCSAEALIETAFHVSTDWTLVLEESGLRKVNKVALSLLLNPPAVSFPLGVKGFAFPPSKTHDEARLPLASHRPADFLVPPFVLPGFTLSDVYSLPDLTLDSWSALGRWVSERRPDSIGGVIISQDLAVDTCFESHLEAEDMGNRERLITLHINDDHSHIFGPESSSSNAGNQPHGHFGVFFPSLDDLVRFSQVACGLVVGGHRLDILLYSEADQDQAFISAGACTLQYQSSSTATTAALIVSSWLSQLSGPFDVIIALTADDIFTTSLLLAAHNSDNAACTTVRLPREDLIYSDWMGDLSLMEWKSTLLSNSIMTLL
jgi:hypothetical protein